jgi:hypothetical protein
VSLARRANAILKSVSHDPVIKNQIDVLKSMGFLANHYTIGYNTTIRREVKVLRDFDLIIPYDQGIYIVGFLRGRRKIIPLTELKKDLPRLKATGHPSLRASTRIFELLWEIIVHYQVLGLQLRSGYYPRLSLIRNHIDVKSNQALTLLNSKKPDLVPKKQQFLFALKRLERVSNPGDPTFGDPTLGDFNGYDLSVNSSKTRKVLNFLGLSHGDPKKVGSPSTSLKINSSNSLLKSLRKSLVIRDRSSGQSSLQSGAREHRIVTVDSTDPLQLIANEIGVAYRMVYAAVFSRTIFDLTTSSSFKKVIKGVKESVESAQEICPTANINYSDLFRVVVARFKGEHPRGKSLPPRTFFHTMEFQSWMGEYLQAMIEWEEMTDEDREESKGFFLVVANEGRQLLNVQNLVKHQGEFLVAFNRWRIWKGWETMMSGRLPFEAKLGLKIDPQQYIRAQLLYLKRGFLNHGRLYLSEFYGDAAMMRAMEYTRQIDPTQHLTDTQWKKAKQLLEETIEKDVQ